VRVLKPRARTDIGAYARLTVLFLISVAHFTANAIDRFDAVRHGGAYAREPFYLGDWNWGAIALQPEAEAAGLKFGDVVLSVNGRPIDGVVTYYGALRQARAGDRLRVQVRAQGSTVVRDLAIVLQPYSSTPGATGLSAYIDLALGLVALPVLCVALGFWVAAMRIRDPSAWLLLVVLLSLACFVGFSVTAHGDLGRDTFLLPLFAAFGVFFSLIAAPALMLFGVVFPERLELDRRFPFLKWLVIGHLTLFTTLVSIAVGLSMHHLAWGRLLKKPVELLTGVEGDFGAAVQLLALIACVGSLGWKTLTAPSRDAKRRLLLLDCGAVAGAVALFTMVVVGRWTAGLPRWSILPLFAMLLAFPLTMAYAIVAHRAMDVRVVIRQGVQYVLARGGIRAIQLALIIGVSIEVSQLIARGGFMSVGLMIVIVAGFATLLRRFADRLRLWVDRRFFREAYEADAILGDLANRVRTMVEVGPLLEIVARRIADSLHVPHIAVLLNEGGTYQLAYALGYGSISGVSISGQSETVKRLRKQQHAIVEPGNEDSWIRRTDEAERASLEQLQPELLLPMSLNEEILGIISLGPKQSEEPFSSTDIQLLDAVAAQTGLALENGRLTEAIKKEVAAREKHKRELEIAREVQERLFPQEYPEIPGLDYAGACRPALGVGGDYYDFIPLPEAGLGIAIGDVSGKGVPAALLMATLRAYLRGQTMHRTPDLTAVMENLNRLVYESSAPNRYATFFYADFDARTRVLTYVNAGHNQPILLRPTTGRRDVLRLDVGGPVIGLMESCCYRQGRVTLESGDVLVAFTDGVSEAMNAGEDEWGEEPLMDLAWVNRTLEARALIDQIMVSADGFVAGAPQRDDMTLVVLRAMS
jgi:phosphoserine phosphatase RsbU/P